MIQYFDRLAKLKMEIFYLGKYSILDPIATDSTGRLAEPTIFSAILNTRAAIVNVELIPTEVGTMPPSAM
jgi:hypothetical protein